MSEMILNAVTRICAAAEMCVAEQCGAEVAINKAIAYSTGGTIAFVALLIVVTIITCVRMCRKDD